MILNKLLLLLLLLLSFATIKLPEVCMRVCMCHTRSTSPRAWTGMIATRRAVPVVAEETSSTRLLEYGTQHQEHLFAFKAPSAVKSLAHELRV